MYLDEPWGHYSMYVYKEISQENSHAVKKFTDLHDNTSKIRYIVMNF
ncbi:MAG: hypothetical protein KGI07_06455 [Thaumarchaeota archaeon]|nr:hypothetical protein [Nitrososphaerota archaeon]